jgi:phosphoribosylanthranilate isomerase
MGSWRQVTGGLQRTATIWTLRTVMGVRYERSALTIGHSGAKNRRRADEGDLVYVKVCGVTSIDAAEAAIEAGADAIGVVFSRKSPRHLNFDVASRIVSVARTHVDTALVVNDTPAAQAATIAGELGVSVIQMHGAYSSDEFVAAQKLFPRLWRATSMADAPDLTVGIHGEEVLILDAPKPGSGRQWDLTTLAERRPTGNWLLAGGLNPDNVAEAIRMAQPWGVDVSSGVESSPGVKDPQRIRAFLAAAHAA